MPVTASSGISGQNRSSSPGKAPDRVSACEYHLAATTHNPVATIAPPPCASSTLESVDLSSGVTRHVYHALKHTNAYSKHSGNARTLASRPEIFPVAVKRYATTAVIASHTTR